VIFGTVIPDQKSVDFILQAVGTGDDRAYNQRLQRIYMIDIK